MCKGGWVSKMFKYIRNESGQAMVFVALFLVVLIGFAALAVDVGAMTVQRSKLQNAADAAALAGVMSINEADVKDEIIVLAHDNINKNSASDIDEAKSNLLLLNATVTSDIKKSDNTVLVNIQQDVPKFLSGIFSDESSTMNVKAKAKLKVGTIFDDFDYAVFSASKDSELKFTANDTIIFKGGVHSNHSIKGHATIVDGVATAPIIDKNVVGEKKLEYKEIPMPEFDIEEIKKMATKLTGDQTFDAEGLNTYLADNKVIYVEGNITITGSGVNTAGTIIATGKITFNGSGVSMNTTSTPLCLCSLYEGEKNDISIEFNGGGSNLYGILYAPNGVIEFDGGSGVLYGRAIGDIVRTRGPIHVEASTDELSSLPSTEKSYRLVE